MTHWDSEVVKQADHNLKMEIFAANDRHDADLALIAELTAALRQAAKIVPIARQHFPKSIRNSDSFALEVTCAAINTALAKVQS